MVFPFWYTLNGNVDLALYFPEIWADARAVASGPNKSGQRLPIHTRGEC